MLDAKSENLQSENEDVNKIDSELTSENKTSTDQTDVPVETTEEKTEEQVVDEIDNHIAKSSEKIEDIDDTAINYDEMDLDALVKELELLLKNNEVQKINKQVNSIKNVFSSKFSNLLAEKKETFLEEGGESIDFAYSNPLKTQFNSLTSDFKEKRDKYYKNLDSELKGNLEIRLNVIEQLKELIVSADSKTMHSQFRALQERWKKIGPVTREKYNDTWRTYHHHVERFYDLLHLSNDFRNLDFKHNLEEKTKLVLQAETLAEEKDINSAFKKLQLLHKRWKEEIGPVAREHREEIWNRFSTATKKIHDKRQDYFRLQKGKHEENIEKKLLIIQQIEEIDVSKNASHTDWQTSIKLIEGLRDQFFKIGRVTKSDSDKIWSKFKDATRKFNHDKNNFYKNVKGVQQENLDQKLNLIKQAEALKESDDWDTATEVMKKIQSDWKKIGHVPRKYSDKIWNQFKNACNHYFDRFHEYKNSGSKEEQEILEKKKVLLDAIKEVSIETESLSLGKVKEYINEWHSLGKIPFSMRHIESKFSKLIDKLFSKLSIDPKELELIKFKNQMELLLSQKNFRKLDNEQLFLRKKIDELVREKLQLENNISFFANAKADNPLLINVQNNISEIESKLTVFKEKLTYLSQLEY